LLWSQDQINLAETRSNFRTIRPINAVCRFPGISWPTPARLLVPEERTDPNTDRKCIREENKFNLLGNHVEVGGYPFGEAGKT